MKLEDNGIRCAVKTEESYTSSQYAIHDRWYCGTEPHRKPHQNANPITGVTTPPPATAVIINPEIWFAFSGLACKAIE